MLLLFLYLFVLHHQLQKLGLVRTLHLIDLDSSLVEVKGWHGLNTTLRRNIIGVIDIDLDKLRIWVFRR
jgi:hypothetical protein